MAWIQAGLRFHTGDHLSHIAKGQEDRLMRCGCAVSNCLIVKILTQVKRFQTKPKRSKMETAPRLFAKLNEDHTVFEEGLLRGEIFASH